MNLTAITELLNPSTEPTYADQMEEARLIAQGDLLLAQLEAEKVRWHREKRDEALSFSI